MKSYYLVFNTNNKLIFGTDLESTYKRFSELKIKADLKDSIKNRIYAKNDFEITVQELQEILLNFDVQIENLLKHPDFNLFKEELRKRFPEQYGSQPFEFKGTTYYLYHKGREFYIDSLIYSALGFKKLIEEHISANKPLKYVFKEENT
jgi:hypothetical protein